MKRYWLVFLVAISLISTPFLYAEITAQLGGMDSSGDYYWTIDDDGTLIGGTGAEISLGGSEKSSWGSVVSPMTDYSGYVAPTDSGSKLKLHDDGDLTLGGAVATNVVITFDSDSNDYYIGVNDTENELQIGYGSAIGTTEQISIQSSGVIMIGEDTDVDSGLVFQAGAQDFYMGIDYTGGEEEDLFCIGLGGTIGTTPEIAIGKSSGMVYIEALTSRGSADLDIGEAGVTDVTVTTDGGVIILDGTITLTDGEIISNATDDTVRIASNDLDTALEIYSPYTTHGDATLLLTADADTDAGDRMAIVHDGASNSMFFQSDISSADTLATIMTLAKTGILTTTNIVESKITDTSTTSVVDVMKLTHDGGSAAGGVGVGLVFQIDDGGGIEEHASIDVSLSTVTDSAEDADFIINLNQAGTMRKVFEIDSDLGDTATNVFEFTSWTTEANGIVDVMELKLETPGDTSTAGLGMGISFQIEDETDAVEEQASIDIIVTDATSTAENADFVINLNNIGTIREAFRIDTDVTATAGTAFEFTSWTIQTDGVIDVLELTLDNTADTATNNIGLGISILIEQEDAGTPVEQSSIDFVLTDAGTGAEDCDVIFSQVVAGTLEERVRFDSDDDTILLTGTTPKMTIGDGGDEDAILTFDGQTNDFYIGFDTTDDLLNIGVGSTPGTTAAIEIDASANVIIVTSLKTPVGAETGTNTLDINESGKLVVLNSATEFTTTLPAVSTASGVTYRFVLAVSPDTGVMDIKTNGGEDKIYGLAIVNGAVIAAAAEDTITFTSSAALIGDWVELTSDGTNWYVSGQAVAATGIVFTAT